MEAKDCERFVSKLRVLTDEDCWEWQGALYAPGRYGAFAIKKPGRKTYTNVGAHRVAWEWENGPIPDGLFVLHACDNKRCANPAHLFLGTQADNVRDSIQKGTFFHGKQATYESRPRGSKHGMAKLTEDQVREILRRHDGKRGSGLKLAQEFGVHRTTISLIYCRKKWQHLKEV